MTRNEVHLFGLTCKIVLVIFLSEEKNANKTEKPLTLQPTIHCMLIN